VNDYEHAASHGETKEAVKNLSERQERIVRDVKKLTDRLWQDNIFRAAMILFAALWGGDKAGISIQAEDVANGAAAVVRLLGG